jgi:hypothetical protein
MDEFKKMDNGRIWGSWALGNHRKMDLWMNWETSGIIQFGEIGQFMNTIIFVIVIILLAILRQRMSVG